MDAAFALARSAADALSKAPQHNVARRELMLALAKVKRHGRAALVRCEAQRGRVRDRRQELEGHILGLQNLLYEKEHLLRDIRLCREFTTPQLARLEAEEGEAVVSAVTTQATAADHVRNLNQLETERSERKRLGRDIDRLREELGRSTEGASNTRRFLDTLPEQLRNIEEASAPLQHTLGLPRSDLRAAHAAATSLPRPLYLAYRQLDALKSRALYPKSETEAFEEAGWVVAGAELDLAVRTAAPGEAEAPPAKRRRTSMDAETGDDAEEEDLEVGGPAMALTVDLGATEAVPAAKVILLLRFSEARKRAVLEVEVEEGLVGPAEGLFRNLFPGDLGEVLGASRDADAGVLQEFAWVQYLCGLEALPLVKSGRSETVLTSDVITRRIVERVRHRSCLEKILQQLRDSKYPLPLHPASGNLFPPASPDRWVLSAWKPVTPPGIAEGVDPFQTKVHLLGGEAGPAPHGDAARATLGVAARERWEFEGSRYFEAELRRDKAQLTALVEVSPEYPVRPPRMLLQARSSGGGGAAIFDHDLKTVEVEVNVYFAELLPEDDGAEAYLLAQQLRRLQVCLDALTDGRPLNSERRGRDRRMALLYKGDTGFEFR